MELVTTDLVATDLMATELMAADRARDEAGDARVR